MKLTSNIFFICIAVILASCGPTNKSGNTQSPEEKMDEAAQALLAPKKYTVYKAPASPEFQDAELQMTGPGTLLDTGTTIFEFKVSNYDLAVQTPDANTRGIANSGKGQHIHFILNNDPYSAHYEPTATKNLPEGRHVVLAFLSRSYHESVKNGSAHVLSEIVVGTPEGEDNFDENAPHLFYSRPKGTYSGKDTEKLLLDFFLFNTDLSLNGNQVRATINGEEHLLNEWAPYYIEGLEKGEVKIMLELIDAEGNVIPGPFNQVERKVMLE